LIDHYRSFRSTLAVPGRLSAVLLTALSTLLASALTAAPANAATPSVDWVANLDQGHGVGVAYVNGALRLTAATGLLTLPARPLAQPVGRLSTQLDAATPPGGTVEVDVRGRLPGGRWTEWLPTRPNAPTTLPGPSSLVQLRVLLTAPAAGAGAARPEVRGLRVHGEVVPGQRVAAPAQAASYRVFATREGLVDGHTANGHQIVPHDLFVALPSWRSLADENGSEYSVKVCSAGGRCAWAPVWDVGPWNTKDDYWSGHREQWHDLPQGVPEAQAAYRDGHNDGRDGTGRTVGNPAGIDLSDGLFDAALGLTDNSEVTVSYLWTGGPALSTVDAGDQQTDTGAAGASATGASTSATGAGTSATSAGASTSGAGTGGSDTGGGGGGGGLSAEQAVAVRGAPAAGAPTVGVAADNAGVPVECGTPNGWLRIGTDQYLPASAVDLADDTAFGPC
jgi:hypothetical protein